MCRREELWSRMTVVTDRKSCRRPFLEQIELLCRERPERILLREKDLGPEEYEDLAKKVKEICGRYQVPFYCHTYEQAAVKTGAQGLHMPLPLFRLQGRKLPGKGMKIGCSVHSLEEAAEAERMGADYLTAGHIFLTDCKKGLPPRGLPFLEEICRAVYLPVYAIVGIQLYQEQI